MELNSTYIPIWPGSSSFTTGSTQYGFFDTDPHFVNEVDKVASWCAVSLGYPTMDVELIDAHMYSAFETAIMEYSNHINQYNIQQNMLSIMGSPTGSNLTHKNIAVSFGGIIQLSKEYGTAAGLNGTIPVYTASIDIHVGQQMYDLNSLVRDVHAPNQNIQIRKIHHYATPASMRFFDPYLNNANVSDTFGGGGGSTATSFLLMPVYADLLRIQAIEFNDQMRKSQYSFEVHNNNVRLFPVPTRSTTLWVEYIISEDMNNVLRLPDGTVSDMSNAPYDLMQYQFINSVGRQWIRKYALATAKETLGNIRSKYQSIPIPNADATLNGGDLLSQAQTEKQQLVEELRTMLESLTRSRLLEQKKIEVDNLNGTLQYVPLPFFVR
jgi:hypothetical protein